MANDDDDKNLLFFALFIKDLMRSVWDRFRREEREVCFIVRHFFLFSFMTLWCGPLKKGLVEY